MITKNEISTIKDLIKEFHPETGFFEEKILFPAVIGRLEYLKSICEHFKTICEDTNVATHIDGALRKLVDPRLVRLGVPEPEVGEQYLSLIKSQLDSEYITPIEELLTQYNNEDTVKDLEKLTEFFNSTINLIQSIPATKDIIFKYSLRSFLNVKEIATGEVLLSPPVELSLILMPFETRLMEMASVAQSTIDSIKEWSKQIRDQKLKYIETMVNLTNVKAATQHASASKYGLFFQVAVIVFSIALVVVSQRATIFLDKKEAERSLELKSLEVHDLKKSLSEKEDIIISLNEELNSLKKPVETVKTK